MQDFHFFYREGGCQHYVLLFIISFFIFHVGRGGPKGKSAKFTISSGFFFGKLPLLLCLKTESFTQQIFGLREAFQKKTEEIVNLALFPLGPPHPT